MKNSFPYQIIKHYMTSISDKYKGTASKGFNQNIDQVFKEIV